jgi:hypothetical protein
LEQNALRPPAVVRAPLRGWSGALVEWQIRLGLRVYGASHRQLKSRGRFGRLVMERILACALPLDATLGPRPAQA